MKSRVHDYPDRPTTSEEERSRLKRYLAYGKANAIKSAELSRLMGYPVTSTNDKIRALAKELLVFDGNPVCSCTQGFFIGNKSEIVEYIGHLESRQQGLARDIQHLKKFISGDAPKLF